MPIKKANATMPAAEFQNLRAYLQAQGFSAGEIGIVIGAAASGRARSAIAQVLVSHLRSLPKKAAAPQDKKP